MNNEFENRLREALAEQSNAIEIEGAGAGAAVNRANERQQRANLGRAFAAVVIVGFLGAFAYAQFSGQGREDFNIAAEDEESDAPSTTIPNAVSTAQAVEVASDLIAGGGEAFGTFLSDEGQLIQITTMPGMSWEDFPENGPPTVVMVSDANGIIETNELSSSAAWQLSASYYDGVLFTVTTSPKSQNNGSDVVVNSSSDFGKTWDTVTIPMPAAPNPDITSVWRHSRVQANSVGTLVTVESNYWIDFTKILPQYSYERGNFEIRQTDTGVEVRDWSEYAKRSEEQALACEANFDDQEEPTEEQMEEMNRCWEEMEQFPEPEVIETFTWEELGIEPVAPYGESAAYFAADGLNFERVTIADGNVSSYVVSTRSAFMAQIHPQFEDELDVPPAEGEGESEFYEDYAPTWLASTDGRNWTTVDLPSGVCNVLGSQGDVFIGQVCEQTGGAYASTDGGNTWTRLGDVPSEAPDGYINYTQVFGGDLGFVAFRNTEPDYGLVEEAFADAMDSGASDEELAQLEEELYFGGDREFEVLFSSDGQTWSVLDLPIDSEGQMVWGSNALVGSSQIVVTVSISGEGSYRMGHLFLTPG